MDDDFKKRVYERLYNKPYKIKETLKYLKSLEYSEYLKTEHWKQIRQKALQRSGYMCENCKSKYKLQVHHKKYRRLGEELLDDLQVLCFYCHHIITHNNKATNKEEFEYEILKKLS